MHKQGLSYYVLCFLALGITGYSIFVYGFMPLGSVVHPDMRANFQAHSSIVYVHIFASSVALLCGALQFSIQLRTLHPQVHRWLGRIYLMVGVLFGGLAGLAMAQTAYGGIVSRLGFSGLALLWLFSGLRAYLAICRGYVKEHQQWMQRNYALTCAAITLRIYLPVSMVSGIGFDIAYPLIAWLCWVPNLIFVEWIIRRQRNLI